MKNLDKISKSYSEIIRYKKRDEERRDGNESYKNETR